MEPLFKIGDVVKLKSGGPEMTISILVNEREPHNLASIPHFRGTYECKWFEGDSLKSGNFFQDTLLLATGNN